MIGPFGVAGPGQRGHRQGLHVKKPEVAVSGSIAYDHIMSFGGSFGDHIIPDKTHVISLSFLVDSLERQRGGVAGNVSFSLALLGTPSYLIGGVGGDFGPYAEAFEAFGVDLTYTLRFDEALTASSFMMADQQDNHIASFFPGPSDRVISVDAQTLGDEVRYALVGATAPSVMEAHARAFGSARSRLIYDPAFQIILLTEAQLREAIDLAWCVVSNDYEFAMIERKTGLSIDDIAQRVELVVVTFGEKGSRLISHGTTHDVPAAPVEQVVDPTGAGDAYRSGLIKGSLLELDIEIVGRLAGLAASYAVEHVGTQAHSYSPEEFVARFDAAFPDCAGAIGIDMLSPAHVAS
jgi:adenosine kinase